MFIMIQNKVDNKIKSIRQIKSTIIQSKVEKKNKRGTDAS